MVIELVPKKETSGVCITTRQNISIIRLFLGTFSFQDWISQSINFFSVLLKALGAVINYQLITDESRVTAPS